MGVSSTTTQEASLWNEAKKECRELKRHVVSKRRSLGRASSKKIVRRRVRTLKKLIPKSESDQGLDGLFKDTADYILSLQMRVRVMEIMVKVLSGSEE